MWWSELNTRDPVAARAYYAAVCGWIWEAMPMPEGDYWVASRGGRPVAGLFDLAGAAGMDEVPPHWMTYLAVDDVAAAAKLTLEAGGSLRRPPFDVPGVGRIAIVKDPAGAVLGLMTPVPAPAG